jgi:HEAT repeat protein
MTPADLLAYAMVALFGVAPVVVSAFLIRLRDRERMAFWGKAAREAGLSAIEPRSGLLEARSGPLEVRIRAYQSEHTAGTRVEVWGPRLAAGLTLRPEGEGTILGRRDRKEIEIGDEDFDQAVSVHGPSALALALLDSDMRRAVASLMRGRLGLPGHRRFWASGRLEHGVLRIDLPEEVRPRQSHYSAAELLPAGEAQVESRQMLPAVLRASLDLAGRLALPEHLAERLASNLRAEPEAGVRRKTLAVLLGEFPEAAATEPAARASLLDPDADVRLHAAVALGKDGRGVLLALAGGEGAEDATNARAVAALGTSLTLADPQDLLRRALRTRRLRTAKACLSLLGRLGGAEAAQTLAKVLLVEKHELGEAAAQALAATADPQAEPSLLRALAEGPAEVKHAAAAALGQVGTRDAVLPLRAAERDGALRSAARQAIAEIHSRLAGAEQGQLSLAEGEAGRLSMVEGESGRLSLTGGLDEGPAHSRPTG